MQIIKSPQDFKKTRQDLIQANPDISIGFVPTMGNLHEGHASLLKLSKTENNITVLSIFINPTQFNNPEDFNKYPKTLEQDLKLAENLNINYVFLPTAENIYPDNYNFKVLENTISQILEGKFRPGHFEGMLTIVLKLLLITQPTRAYFGEKDYQQYLLIKNMAQAFFIDTQIIGCPTVRNINGLPLSSRNNRFTEKQFEHVQLFPQIFHANLSPDEITTKLTQANFEVEYIEEHDSRRFGAVKYAGIRLIDNIEVQS